MRPAFIYSAVVKDIMCEAAVCNCGTNVLWNKRKITEYIKQIIDNLI